MVFPYSIDLQIFPCQALRAESQLLNHLQGSGISWHDVGFYPMQPQLIEGVTDDTCKTFRHEALVYFPLIQPIA